ncbi:LCP family protein [Nocardioides sp.]|uniref:LCP family protein n=1 Tax=Nocardioides sp. TaxID=35761 RepID=UPI0039E4FBE1
MGSVISAAIGTLRRLRRRILTTTALAVVLAVTALALPDSTTQEPDTVLVATAKAKAVDIGKDVVWILAVGSDARRGEHIVKSRGDAIQMVGINPKTGAAAILGVPRDSWVEIPGYGSNKINSALYFGGPELFGEVVGNLVGIQPDYVFITGFGGLRDLVRSIGGVTVDNPTYFNDSILNPEGYAVGKIHVNGDDAVTYGRARHSLLRGDFDRSANQQRLLKGIQQKVRRKRDQAGFLAKGVLGVIDKMYTDLSPAKLFKLAHLLAAVNPNKVTNCVVQGSIGTVGEASVVLPFTDMARQMGKDAKDDAVISECLSPW